MATKIITKNSSTASAVPLAADLVQGELAVNVTDKKLYTKNNAGSVVSIGDTPSIVDNGNATAITIDSSENVSFAQNVGIGTSSPTLAKTVISGTYNGLQLALTTASNGTLGALMDSNGGFIGTFSGATVDALRFGTTGSERMRIDSSGNLLVGYTAKGATTATGHIAANAYATKAGIGAALGGNVFNIEWSSSSAKLWIDATNVGTISLTSDYRIKQNIETQSAPALERVMQLRPVTYQLKDYGTLHKADGVAREGFIAHELQAVIPSAVEGEKDAEDQIQSLKLDALCSVLTKAIQEQQAIITQLQADVAALKGQA